MNDESEIRRSIEYAIELTRFTPPMDIFITSMSELDTIIEEADVIYHYEKVYELIYAHIISILETYLSDTFLYAINKYDCFLRSMIKKSDFIKGEKYSIRQMYDYGDDLKNIINYKLQQLVWHKISSVKSLYKDTLEIEFPDKISIVQEAINTRHDIVHRNGSDRRGNKISITKSDLIELRCSVEKFVTFVNNQALDRFKNAIST